MADLVVAEKKGMVGYVILNRPEKLNALTAEMYSLVRDLVRELDEDKDVRVIILKGNGRAFSAGWDLTAHGPDDPMDSLRVLESANNGARWQIWNARKPVIAQLHRYCLGGALELAIPCDFIIASDDCIIGEPEIQFGEPPGFLQVPWLVGILRSKALLLTGDKITGKEAAEIGLATEAVPAESLEDEVEKLAAKLKRIPPPAMMLQKRGINRAFEIMGLKSAIDSWADINLLMSMMKTDEVKEFNRIVKEKGLKEALAWQEQLHVNK